jgi:hypothetical protein
MILLRLSESRRFGFAEMDVFAVKPAPPSKGKKPSSRALPYRQPFLQVA